jgi:hypothetical protein
MMVQIVEHRAETSVDFVVEEEAASSTPQVPNRPVPGTAAVHAARQQTAVQTSRTPLRATPGALLAARELLRHPPSSCNALNLGVEFFLLFSHQIRALLSFLFPRFPLLPNFKPV